MSSTTVTPMAIENEVEQVLMYIRELNEQIKQSEYFGTQLSIADILYYWEISTV